MRTILTIVFVAAATAAMFVTIVCFVSGGVQIANGNDEGIPSVLVGIMAAIMGFILLAAAGGVADDEKEPE